MQLREGIDDLIKDDIPRDIDASYEDIEALKTLVLIAIPKKDTLLRSELEFVLVIGTGVRPARAPEDMQRKIVWLNME
jgi:glycine cleavage system pyridoxal-binding protein P